MPDSDWPAVKPKFGKGQTEPYFNPGPAYEASLARDRLRPNRYGGISKKDMLGSVEDSWGPIPAMARQYGMFEVEDDPPSRSTSPFCEEPARARSTSPSREGITKATTSQEFALVLPKRYHPRPPLKRLQAQRDKPNQGSAQKEVPREKPDELVRKMEKLKTK